MPLNKNFRYCCYVAAAFVLGAITAPIVHAQTVPCADTNTCPPPEIEDLRSPCEKLGGCQSFGKKRSGKGNNNGFGTRTQKTNVSFASKRSKHTNVFKAGNKKKSQGRGSKARYARRH